MAKTKPRRSDIQSNIRKNNVSAGSNEAFRRSALSSAGSNDDLDADLYGRDLVYCVPLPAVIRARNQNSRPRTI
jgi:hypothetical protein